MGMDLTSNINLQQFVKALAVSLRAREHDQLNDVESNFVKDMAEEWQMNGSMYEPSLKQFEWLKQIAFEQEKSRRRG